MISHIPSLSFAVQLFSQSPVSGLVYLRSFSLQYCAAFESMDTVIVKLSSQLTKASFPMPVTLPGMETEVRLASVCREQLGKQADKPDGRDLTGAQETIGMLVMLRDKTKGSLTGTEERILNDTVLTLQKSLEEETGGGIPKFSQRKNPRRSFADSPLSFPASGSRAAVSGDDGKTQHQKPDNVN